MCGLVGTFGMLTPKHDKAFKDMLLMDVVRGDDSTGVASIGYDQSLTILKEVGPPSNILYDEVFSQLIKRYNRLLMGHNRFATIGKVTKENAHPFAEEHIVGAHNGTINQSTLPDNEYFSSDSANLIYAISLEGIKKTWKNLDGAAALTYWDMEKKEFNMICNDRRPLCYAFSEDRTSIIWASESWMIQGAAARNKLVIENKIFVIYPHFLHTFNIKDGQIDHWYEELDHYIPPTPKAFSPSYSCISSSWRKDTVKDIQESAEKVKALRVENTTASNRKARKIERKLKKQAARLKRNNEEEAKQLAIEKKVLEAESRKVSHNPQELSREEFDNKFDKCVFCDDWLVYEDANVQISEDTMSCQLCADTATSLHMIN